MSDVGLGTARARGKDKERVSSATVARGTYSHMSGPLHAISNTRGHWGARRIGSRFKPKITARLPEGAPRPIRQNRPQGWLMTKRVAQYPFEKVQWTRCTVPRALISGVCALLPAAIAIGITDSPRFPATLRYVFSPGNVAEHWAVSGSLAHSISTTLFRMWVIDAVYYAVLLFLLLTWRLRRRRL